ncbi:hypothetical protein [Streptomyces poriferorum]|uniref:hypothetical protein n=1 Tax=Streptomyces poriferorum TaxID=2798799 RepID=UPI001C5D4663|nr:hypothetical protein [Streptomyces poriferorum]MBW5258627.1 hypothetical protein [Streptomyces poriferorum]
MLPTTRRSSPSVLLLDPPPVAQWSDDGLLDDGHALPVGVLDRHRVLDPQRPALHGGDAPALAVLDVVRAARPQGLAVDLVLMVAGLVVDPVVVTDGDHLLPHPETGHALAVVERAIGVTAVLALLEHHASFPAVCRGGRTGLR